MGVLQISTWLFKFISFAYRHTLKGHKNFKNLYNQGDSWAVISGGSDGIGEQFCRDLAAKGFNICIIARNEQKIKEKLVSIKAEAA